MSRIVKSASVLTLAETAKYLRTTAAAVRQLAEQGVLPARQINGEWRFLREAIHDWLRRPQPPRKGSREALLEQFGVFKEDETLLPMLEEIYAARGRSMLEVPEP